LQWVDRKYGIIALFTWMTCVSSFSQVPASENFRIQFKKDSVAVPGQLIRGILTQDLAYYLSFSASRYDPGGSGNSRNILILLQSLKYRVQYKKDSILSFLNSITHDLGGQFFCDSIAQIHPDETTLATRLVCNPKKFLNLSFTSDLTSCLINNYSFDTDQNGKLHRTPTCSFLTPLVLTFSLGFGHSWPGSFDLNFGVTSAKLTWIRNRNIPGAQNSQSFYGVPKGKRYLFEYGLSFRFLADKDVCGKIHWNCDLLLFKNFLSCMDVSLKNILTLKLGKFIRTSIQTKILYGEKTGKNFRIENNVDIGLAVTL
jgi:hypothetical protein